MNWKLGNQVFGFVLRYIDISSVRVKKEERKERKEKKLHYQDRWIFLRKLHCHVKCQHVFKV